MKVALNLSWILACCLAAVLSACESVPSKEADTPTVDVTYKLAVPQGAPRYELSFGEDVELPKLIEYVTPTYPAEKMSRKDVSVEITARLVLNESGIVDRAIFEVFSSDEDLELYRNSIRDAVADWKFTPLKIIRSVKSGGGKNSFVKTAQPCSLWYRFRFVVTNGQAATTLRGQPPQ